MKKPRKKTSAAHPIVAGTKPKWSAARWDLFYGPIHVGKKAGFTSVAGHRKDTEEILDDYLARAMGEPDFLPPAVTLAQFVSVRQERHGNVELSTHAVVRSDGKEPEDSLRAFAMTASYSRKNKWSFHNKVSEELHCPAGTILVFTVAQSPPPEHPLDGVNVIWFTYPSDARLIKINLSLVGAVHVQPVGGNATLCRAEVLKILEDRENQQAFAIPLVYKTDARCHFYYKAGLSTGDKENVVRFAESLLTDKYLGHVLPCVLQGPVVLAAPKKLFFSEKKEGFLVDNSGLTAMFRQGTRLGFEELDRCFRVAHQMSTAFTTLYGVAHLVGDVEREHGATTAYNFITHSLGNAIKSIPRGNLAAERILSLERFTLRAAPGLQTRTQFVDPYGQREEWRSAGVKKNGKHESLEETIAGAIFVNLPDCKINCVCLRKVKGPDPRFVALIIELARNLRHSKSGAGSITVLPSSETGLFDITVVSTCDYAFPETLKLLLQAWAATPAKTVGLEFITLLATSVSTKASRLDYHIGPRNTASRTVASFNIGGPAIQLSVASSEHTRFEDAKAEGRLAESFECWITLTQLRGTL